LHGSSCWWGLGFHSPRPPGGGRSGGGRGPGGAGGRGLPGRGAVFRRALLRLLRAVVAADGGLLAADLHLDSLRLDFPVAHGTLLRLHEASVETGTNGTVAAPSAGDPQEDRVAGPQRSGFQILAHFAKRSGATAAHVGGRKAELTAEGVGEV